MNSKHPETLALHAGWRRDPATNAVHSRAKEAAD
jgi:hypothetical protein